MVENEKQDTKKEFRITQYIFDILEVLVECLVIVVILSCFVFRTFKVDGESMMNTLHHEDKVVLTNFQYKPKNGDIVVIPNTHKIPVPIIKRVIAVGGQTLKIDFKNNKVYVDGNLLDESYISSKTIRGNASIPKKIPEGYVFVMGDNRSHSTDSRFREVGLIKEDHILGKMQFTWWPFDRIGSPYKK